VGALRASGLIRAQNPSQRQERWYFNQAKTARSVPVQPREIDHSPTAARLGARRFFSPGALITAAGLYVAGVAPCPAWLAVVTVIPPGRVTAARTARRPGLAPPWREREPRGGRGSPRRDRLRRGPATAAQ